MEAVYRHGSSEETRSHGAWLCRVAEGGKGRIIYPRIDPAAIMLVSCGDYVLLGRQSRWAPGRYSCLAGNLTCPRIPASCCSYMQMPLLGHADTAV